MFEYLQAQVAGFFIALICSVLVAGIAYGAYCLSKRPLTTTRAQPTHKETTVNDKLFIYHVSSKRGLPLADYGGVMRAVVSCSTIAHNEDEAIKIVREVYAEAPADLYAEFGGAVSVGIVASEDE